MFFGLLQFWFAKRIFGDVGKKPIKNSTEKVEDDNHDKRVPFTNWQYFIIAISAILGLTWILNEPASLISDGAVNFLNFELFGLDGNSVSILFALLLFVILLVFRLSQYSKITREKMLAVTFFAFLTIFFWGIFEQSPGTLTIFARDYTNRVLEGNAGFIFKIVNTLITIVPLSIITWVLFLYFKQTFKKYGLSNFFLGFSFLIIWALSIWMLTVEFQKDTAEIKASWFGVLNSLFIITFAPLFSKWWESKYNPSANVKFGIGMFLLATGMAIIAFGSRNIAPGAQTASVSFVWLIFVYLFHTLGELCVSPLGLSYVSKLVPSRMIALMFGIWYLAVAIGMKLAGKFGENIDKIANTEGISYFFWILTIIPVVLGIFSIIMNPVIKKLMHGVK
jgi:proton-dependent oligopeptide transporter, POT family